MKAVGDGHYAVNGELTFATVPQLWRGSATLFTQGGQVEMDLQGVTRADSAGIALLIEWSRGAHQGGGKVSFLNVPAQILAIARVGGLDEVLSLAEAG